MLNPDLQITIGFQLVALKSGTVWVGLVAFNGDLVEMPDASRIPRARYRPRR